MELEKEIELLNRIFGAVKLTDSSADELFKLAQAYLSDSQHFFDTADKDNALEAYSIAWAYLDALLHLGLAKIPAEFMHKFTVE